MIKLLANLGRFNTVAIITGIAAVASLAVTATAVTLLNNYGFDIKLNVAAAFAIGVPLVVTPPICWLLVSLMFRIYHIEEEMRCLASYDSLTGLMSRHAFFDNANNYVSLARRERSAELLGFAGVVDNAMLKLFADVINSVARRSDIVGRLGGEEFAIVLPSTSNLEAIEFSGRLHNAIDKAVLKYNGAAIKYTASIGLTAYDPGSSDNIDDMLARADLALYQAKRSGRNQTATFNPEIRQVATA